MTAPASADTSASPGREPPLIEQISNQLSRDILAGRYGPGDRIREPEVAARLGVSRAPVREALRYLEQEGLVELTAWRGARVINPPLSEIAALFDLLGAVFGVVARLAARNTGETEIAHWCEYIDRMEQAGRDSSMLEVIDLAYRAGTYLGHVCGSERAGSMLYRIGKTTHWLHRYLVPAPARERQQAVNRYRKLATALCNRDEDRAERAAKQIVKHTQQFVVTQAQQSLTSTPTGDDTPLRRARTSPRRARPSV